MAYLSNQAPLPSTLQWFADIGATRYITLDLTNIHQVEDYRGSDQVQIGYRHGLSIHRTGNSSL